MKKRTLAILFVILAVILLWGVACAPAMADTGAGEIAPAESTEAVAVNALIENGTEIVSALVITLIGIFGTWITLKIGKHEELQNINEAQQELIRAAKMTVGELQQTIVEGLKAAHADGKLTNDEIKYLGAELLTMTKAKMSMSAYALLEAAQVDINALITGAGENWINKLKKDV